MQSAEPVTAPPEKHFVQSLGLLAVKLGQVHALRIDFLDREKCEHLARLYRRNAVLAPQDFQALLRAAALLEGHGWGGGPLGALSDWLLTRRR